MNNEFFYTARFTDEEGEVYYCPVGAVENSNDRSSAFDDCVEASTMGRYAGNIKIVE